MYFLNFTLICILYSINNIQYVNILEVVKRHSTESFKYLKQIDHLRHYMINISLKGLPKYAKIRFLSLLWSLYFYVYNWSAQTQPHYSPLVELKIETVWSDPIWIKVKTLWQILPQGGLESPSIKIPPFIPHFLKFKKK